MWAVEEEEETDPMDSASRVFRSRILSIGNVDDVNAITLAQKNMLDRFEKTNEMLANFNNLSSACLQQMSEPFLHHARTLVEMKRDLDSIFRRIGTLKGKLARQHPEALSHIPEASLLEDDEEDPIPPSTTTTITTSGLSTGSGDTSPVTISPSFSPGFEDLSHIPPDSPAIDGHSRWMTRRCGVNSPAPRSSGGHRALQVSEVVGGNPASRWSALSSYSVIQGTLGDKAPSQRYEILRVSHSHSFLTETISLIQTLFQARE